MNIQRLGAFINKGRELAPLHILVLFRWLCRHSIQQERHARSASRRTQRQLKKGQISVFQHARAHQHLELCRQMVKHCDDQRDQSGQFLSGLMRQMVVDDYPREHLSALFNIPTERLLSKIEELKDVDRDLTVFDLVFHHVECQDPGCDFVPNDDSMPLFHSVLGYFMAEMGRNRELRKTMDEGFTKFFPSVRRMYLQPPGPDGRQAAYQEQAPLVVHRSDGTTRTVERPMRLIGYTQPGFES